MCRLRAFLLALLLVMAVAQIREKGAISVRKNPLIVMACPPMPMMQNVSKDKLLGIWFAYATTPLPFEKYQRRCISHNVKGSNFFNTSILYTNYRGLTITYRCAFAAKVRRFQTLAFLKSVNFPVAALDWLKTEAFCFELYELKFETQMRPIQYQAPFNQPGELG
ncbi:uncharacterized protein [Drosophila virilis]|uniref:Uncharacterized protein, isoform B n=1 Tax=Drosophila virilis TaxID=7244 RepID=A0A0Q9WKD0_DROVI|nr:uncharacterized protein LOC26531331 isoform X2 [Drosophila virilis]KRF81307.1 uncharacterized protein Dvir_GJ26561, isoform B [Drosophila virilis]